jgi:hypothetical protein
VGQHLCLEGVSSRKRNTSNSGSGGKMCELELVLSRLKLADLQ